MFDDLVGKTMSFYGVDNNWFKLDRKVYEAVENEDDGYRSYLGSVEVVDRKDLIFFKRRLARVTVEEYGDGSFYGYVLRDVSDGHVWLRFGTNNSDDYYPWFVFEYQPKGA